MPNPSSQITITLRDGPSVVTVERLSIGTAVLRTAEPVESGALFNADLGHPSFGTMKTAAHVAWVQQIAPGLPLTLVGLEFIGTWEKLGSLRKGILGVVASDARVGDVPLGWVTTEPDGTWTCFARDSMKIALVSNDAKGLSVRRRDPVDPAGVLLPATSFGEAMVLAFDRSPTDVVALDPPIGPASGAHARPASAPPAKSPASAPTSGVLRKPGVPPKKPEEPKRRAAQPISESAEDAILAAKTIMVGPDESHVDETEILAARTLRLEDGGPPPGSEDDVLAAQTIVLPKDRVAPKGEGGIVRAWSKVQHAGKLVGWIAPDTQSAWTIYDEQRRKIAVATVEPGSVRVCWLGDKSTESFEYFEAPTAAEAMAAAFELDAPPKIDPPL